MGLPLHSPLSISDSKEWHSDFRALEFSLLSHQLGVASVIGFPWAWVVWNSHFLRDRKSFQSRAHILSPLCFPENLNVSYIGPGAHGIPAASLGADQPLPRTTLPLTHLSTLSFWVHLQIVTPLQVFQRQVHDISPHTPTLWNWHHIPWSDPKQNFFQGKTTLWFRDSLIVLNQAFWRQSPRGVKGGKIWLKCLSPIVHQQLRKEPLMGALPQPRDNRESPPSKEFYQNVISH